jgi:alkaline phosphatase D
MRRRQFLKSAGCFVASASAMSWLGCSSDDDDASSSGSYTFPQGVASGDPQPHSVMLWTRVVPKEGTQPVTFTLELSESSDFTNARSERLTAESKNDYTVRVHVTELNPDSTYYYRFVAGADTSRPGRTRTAPEADASVEPRFAWVSCQDYAANYYSAYRRMLNDDLAAPESEQLHFVLFVGDFIYETRNAGFMQAVNDDLERVMLTSSAGTPRLVPAFPSGGAERADGASYANSIDDYRHLYKHYLTDPDLQDARARWPFVNVWDDHEFTDDCWQTQANYTNDQTSDEPSQKRRVAASQAWFEYIPAALSDAGQVGDVPQSAKDFVSVEVEDAPYDDVVVVDEPNNVKAIGAITIYRNFRWGKHLELVITDNRSYRSDQPLAEQATKANPLIFDPRVALPKDAVNAMDAGRDANGGMPQDSVDNVANTRKASPPGSMLGEAQKAWWKSVLAASDATFKVWANSVPLLRFLLDRTDVTPVLVPNDLVLSDDAWDGYNSERKELMTYLKEQNILNVVSLSGDHHAFFAGLVHDDYDAAQQTPVMFDIVTAGISSNSQWSAVAAVLTGDSLGALGALIEPVKQLIVYDATKLGGTSKAVVNLNTLIRYGSKAANVAATTNDLDEIAAARDPKINAHLRYVDSHAFGYGVAHVSADALEAKLVSIERSFTDLGKDSPALRGTATFTVPRVDKLADLSVDEPELTGDKPFPLAAS